MPVFKHLHLLILLQLEVIQVIVVDVNLMTQIDSLSLLNLDQRVPSHEVCTSVPAWIRETEPTGLNVALRLVQAHLLVPVLILGHGRLRILLVPLNHEAPYVWVSMHPITHELETESDFDDPIGHDLHPLEVALVVRYCLEEDFEPL